MGKCKNRRKMINHPYINYACGLVGKSYEDITFQDLVNHLALCANAICLQKTGTDDNITFVDTDKPSNKEDNIFMAPYVIVDDKSGVSLIKEINEVVKKLKEGKNNQKDVKKTFFPIGGDYTKFTDAGGATKSISKVSLKDYALILITGLTKYKPSMTVEVLEEIKGKRRKVVHTICVLPDFNSSHTTDFIDIFKRIQMRGGEFRKALPNGKPQIYNGNFPNAVKSKYLKMISILGAIGEVKKETEYSCKATNVFEALREGTLLMITSGGNGAEIVQFSHHIIDIAGKGNLRQIIDGLYYSRFYKFKGLHRTDGISLIKKYGISKDSIDVEYEKYDYYLSKFLILFNHYSFNEFISCRMEYPYKIKVLITKYFHSMEKVNLEIIDSAEALGSWINRAAFHVAKKEECPSKNWEKMNDDEKQKTTEKKFKFLVELESSVFSASDGVNLISHTLARVGRLSGEDAPYEAKLFIKAVMSSEISVEVAKNLLIAFSRIKSVESPNTDKSVKEVNQEIDCSNL